MGRPLPASAREIPEALRETTGDGAPRPVPRTARRARSDATESGSALQVGRDASDPGPPDRDPESERRAGRPIRISQWLSQKCLAPFSICSTWTGWGKPPSRTSKLCNSRNSFPSRAGVQMPLPYRPSHQPGNAPQPGCGALLNRIEQALRLQSGLFRLAEIEYGHPHEAPGPVLSIGISGRAGQGQPLESAIPLFPTGRSPQAPAGRPHPPRSPPAPAAPLPVHLSAPGL